MARVREFLLPDVGEGLTEAEIVRWHVAAGDHVVVNQPLAEIETAKALVELPCPFDGVVREVLAPTGVVLPVGTALVVFEVESDGSDEAPDLLVGYGASEAPAPARRRRVPSANAEPSRALPASGRVRAKPPVRLMARRLGLDLAGVPGTGPGGAVTRDDVQRAVSGGGRPVVVPVPALPGDVRTPASAVQRAMAESMTLSATTVPQAMVWTEVDASQALAEVKRLRADPQFEGARVTVLTLAASALAQALVEHPGLNVAWDAAADEIVQRADVNLGVAVAAPRGLVVPVLRGVQALELPDLARGLTTLADTAREGRTAPADMQGGTATLTNIGSFGADGGIPILKPPEAVILAMGRVRDRPWVVDGQVVVRPVLHLSLVFDHRVAGGVLATEVLMAVARRLESP